MIKIKTEFSKSGSRDVLLIEDPKTKIITLEAWVKNGGFDRPDGPALIERDPITGVSINEEWWSDGVLVAAQPDPN